MVTVLQYGARIGEKEPSITVRFSNGYVLRANVDVLYPTYADAEAEAKETLRLCLEHSSYHKLERQRNELVKLLAATTAWLARFAATEPTLSNRHHAVRLGCRIDRYRKEQGL